jgi:hypothetical protein
MQARAKRERDSAKHQALRAASKEMTPDSNKPLMIVAAVLLAIPVVALLWVDSFARVEPTLGGFPFFIWYQFLWVFLCAACTWAAYRVVLAARSGRREPRR